MAASYRGDNELDRDLLPVAHVDVGDPLIVGVRAALEVPCQYYAQMALRAGVPPHMLADVVQEIRVALCLPGGGNAHHKVVARRAIINWLRAHGARTRAGRQRPLVSYAAAELAQAAPYSALEALADVARAWPRLTARQRECILLSVKAARPTTNAEQVSAYQGRLRLRRWTAA